jgi:hypothetical protein
LLPESVTVTPRALNAVFTVAFCGVVPAFAVMLDAPAAVFVSEKLTFGTPATAADTVYGPPAVALAVNGADATPDALVAIVIVLVALLKVPDEPKAGAVKVTFTPGTTLLPESRTVTARAFGNAVLIVVLWGVVPAFAVADEGLPVRLVSEKLTVGRPADAAVTVYGPPAVLFAAKGAEAIPDALLTTVIVVVALPNKPEGPEDGAVNVTFMPGTGLLPASRSVTAGALAKAVLMMALCGVVPAFTVIEVGVLEVFVREKLTVARPADAAVTV